jgi:hypothetical protein
VIGGNYAAFSLKNSASGRASWLGSKHAALV